MDKLFPGKCPTGAHEKDWFLDSLNTFIGTLSKNKKYADIGPINEKIQYLKRINTIKVSQIDSDDFNNDMLKKDLFDVVFCFEIIEHLQNPLFFMSQIKGLIKEDGIIYLSTPCRPRWMWADFHFFEMDAKHLEKWICIPLGLIITRKKRLRLPYRLHNFGIRPILRYFLNATYIYEIIKTGNVVA